MPPPSPGIIPHAYAGRKRQALPNRELRDVIVCLGNIHRGAPRATLISEPLWVYAASSLYVVTGLQISHVEYLAAANAFRLSFGQEIQESRFPRP